MRDVQQATNARIEPADFTHLPSRISRRRMCFATSSADATSLQEVAQPRPASNLFSTLTFLFLLRLQQSPVVRRGSPTCWAIWAVARASSTETLR
jgi:hypothetical protein